MQPTQLHDEKEESRPPISDKPDAKNWEPPARVGIIGGLGEMGRLFAKFFQDQGYSVAIADVDTVPGGRELATNSDILLFSVPLHRTAAIIREIVPFTRADQLLMDLTSLKVNPIQEMLQSPAAVVGLHPMFGGRVSSFAGQTLVACPARIAPAHWALLKQRFAAAGMRVKECSPAEHDRMMSIIQVLFHMTTMLKGRVLRELGIDIAESMDFTSPSYRLEMLILGRLFAQSAELYSAMAQMNPYTGELIEHLRQGLNDYAAWFENKNLDGFVQDFKQSATAIGEFCDQAYQESSTILDMVVRMDTLVAAEDPDRSASESLERGELPLPAGPVV
jgi:prephenate dehydrogenase